MSMRFLILIIAVLLPILDIASLIWVGDHIGLWPTLGAVVLSAVIGMSLVRAQGLTILANAQATLRDGKFPARQMFDGLCALIGGAMLAFPGFLSDVLGLLLLTPPARLVVWRAVERTIARSGHFAVWTVGDRSETRNDGSAGPVIDGEFQPVKEPPAPRLPLPTDGTSESPKDSPWRRPGPGEVVRADNP